MNLTGDLHTKWVNLAKKYCTSILFVEWIWMQLEKNYSHRKRHYHNFQHIFHMLEQAEENEKMLEDIDVVMFSIWFHDIIYKPSRKDNEEKSAEYTRSVLEKTSLGGEKINRVCNLIISTKKHQSIVLSIDNDLLLDFDLSILGQPWNIYKEYIQSIRKEYSLYPTFLYNAGRKKVLKGFLKRDSLYFTEKYRTLYEEQARKNLEKEIKLLS